jgi:hypothetical protein
MARRTDVSNISSPCIRGRRSAPGDSRDETRWRGSPRPTRQANLGSDRFVHAEPVAQPAAGALTDLVVG